jgi:hypothetical protein
MGIWWCMTTLFDRLRLDYRERINAIRKEFPCTYQDFVKALNDTDKLGKLTMKVVSDMILFNIIRSHNEAYQMFYTEKEYEAQWARYVEDEMYYESLKEMEGEGNYE